MASAGSTAAGSRSLVRRWLPVIIILGLIAAAFACDWDDYLTLDALRRHRETLQGFVAAHPFEAPLLFMAVYAAVTALSLPGGIILTLAGGFLFGTLAGAAWVTVGATAGAILVFLIARTALGDSLRRRAGPWLAKMEQGFNEDALSYLVVLRLIPVFPFWLVNLVPALLGVSLRTYALGTFLGIIPGCIVFTSVGNGLGEVLDAGGTPDLAMALRPEILLPLVGLVLLAMAPVAYKRWRARRG